MSVSLFLSTPPDLLTEMIHKVNWDPASDSPGGFKVLIVDEATMEILTSTCPMFVIVEGGVTRTPPPRTHPFQMSSVSIHRGSPSLSWMPSISLLPPNNLWTASSRTSKQPGGHSSTAMFTSSLQTVCDCLLSRMRTPGVPEPLMDRIGSSPLCTSGRLKSLVELNVSFLALEQRVFVLYNPEQGSDAFVNLYGAKGDAGQIHEEIANKLLTLCVSLGENPTVRFWTSPSPNGRMCARVGELTQAKLNASKHAPTPTGASLIIVERSADCLAPLLHEFTMQALVGDVLAPAGSNGAVIPGQSKPIYMIEDNDVWVQYRHLHLAAAMGQVKQDQIAFRDANTEAVAYAAAREKEGKREAKNMAEVAQLGRVVGKFSREKEALQAATSLVDAVYNIYRTQGLEQIAYLEQDMATGEDANGKSVSSDVLNGRVMNVINNPQVPADLKLRLMMLLVISQEGLDDTVRDTLLAKMTEQQDKAMRNLAFLGVSLAKSRTKSSWFSRGSKKQARPGEDTYDVSRFVPRLREVMVSAARGSLSLSEYPLVGGTASATTAAASEPAQGHAMGLWGKKKKTMSTAATTSTGPVKGRVIVFVIGGMTFSEIRSAYEASNETGTNIVIGSTHLLRPQLFLEGVARLKA